jgi:hypothetical protein
MRFPHFAREKEDAMLKKAMEAEKGKDRGIEARGEK